MDGAAKYLMKAYSFKMNFIREKFHAAKLMIEWYEHMIDF
jgi:hypothetical protein